MPSAKENLHFDCIKRKKNEKRREKKTKEEGKGKREKRKRLGGFYLAFFLLTFSFFFCIAVPLDFPN